MTADPDNSAAEGGSDPGTGRARSRGWARYASCAIQADPGGAYVSDSPRRRIFDRLGEVHRQINEAELTNSMCAAGYHPIFRDRAPLPNGKALVRLDFERN